VWLKSLPVRLEHRVGGTFGAMGQTAVEVKGRAVVVVPSITSILAVVDGRLRGPKGDGSGWRVPPPVRKSAGVGGGAPPKARGWILGHLSFITPIRVLMIDKSPGPPKFLS